MDNGVARQVGGGYGKRPGILARRLRALFGTPSIREWRLRFSRSMTPVFLGLAVALLAIAILIGQTILAQRDARRHAMAEGDALISLQRVLVTMLDAETGQRGYLITGDQSYLGPYVAARQRLSETLDKLESALDKSNSADPADLVKLKQMTGAKFAEMDRSVKLAGAGFPDQARAVVGSDIGKIQMDAIRKEIVRLGTERAANRALAFEQAGILEDRLLPLVGFLSLAIVGVVAVGLRAERRRAEASAEAEQAGALREANERAQLLTRELNHRVKNLFSVILAIVTLSGRKRAPSDEVVEDIRARIHALSRAHETSQGNAADSSSSLGAAIVRTMQPYADSEGRRVRIDGPQVDMPARMVTPIGLIIHELATNAAKYGALSTEQGMVEICWELSVTDMEAPRLTLRWIEKGGPPLSADMAASGAGAKGFGSRMIVLAAGQLGGEIEREWPPSGAMVRVTFPLI